MGSEGKHLRRALEVEFNDDVHHSLRSCENLFTYLPRASDRALSQPFIDWFAVADRTFSPKDLSTVVDRLICAWNPQARGCGENKPLLRLPNGIGNDFLRDLTTEGSSHSMDMYAS